MERFVIGAALFAAAAIAVGSYFGHVVSDGDGFSFVIVDDDKGSSKAPGAPATQTPQVYAAQALRVRNAVAILEVIPEDRTDISLGVTNPGKLAMLTLRVSGSEVVVDGGLRMRSVNCSGSGFNVDVHGVGKVSESQMPVITARVPRDVKVSTGGAVKSNIGPSTTATLNFAGCGTAKIGDVSGALDLSNSGSGDVQASSAQTLKISSAGPGDTTATSVAGKVDASLVGSGDVSVDSMTGPLSVSLAGSGDINIGGGAVTDVDVSIAGSGGVTIDAPVQALDVSIAGSGDVTVNGAAQSVKASVMGSGDVSVSSVSGSVEKSVLGSGSVSVGP